MHSFWVNKYNFNIKKYHLNTLTISTILCHIAAEILGKITIFDLSLPMMYKPINYICSYINPFSLDTQHRQMKAAHFIHVFWKKHYFPFFPASPDTLQVLINLRKERRKSFQTGESQIDLEASDRPEWWHLYFTLRYVKLEQRGWYFN